MVKLAGIFRSIQPFSVLVLGDFMLDTYTTGRVRRISPEAPVPVLEVQSVESRPGGAGNVVLNLAALGAKTIACGRLGRDGDGEHLSRLLSQEGIDPSGLILEHPFRTPVKNRLIGDSQQLLRVDCETVAPLQAQYESEVIAFLEKMIPEVHVVAISDYGKGFLTRPILAAAIEICRRANVPAVVDPKGIDFSKYKGAHLIKPNLSEAYAAAKMPSSSSLDDVAAELLRATDADRLLITRSEAGMSLYEKEKDRVDFPVRSREVKDVTGAGDTVLSLICLGIANGLEIDASVQLANVAAGIAIERIGCAQISLSEIAQRLLEIDSDTKLFDENHTYALRKVLQDRKYEILVLNSHQEMTGGLFRALFELSTHSAELLIYIRGKEPTQEFVHLLSSLKEVDFIILQTESLKHLCEAIHPAEIYTLENDCLIKIPQPKELLSSLLTNHAAAETKISFVEND